MMAILGDEDKKFMNKIQRFCIKTDKKVDHMKDDIYEWIPDFGAEGYVTRSQKFPEFDLGWNGPDGYYGLTADLVRAIALDQFNPQFNMGAGASVLAINPIYHHHENMDHRLQAVKDMVTGKEVGCIMITEPEVGSDAVRPLTKCEEQPDGSFAITGEKIYNTNAPKSKYGVFYAALTPGDSSGVMQGLFTDLQNTPGCVIKRVGIPWTPKLFLGNEIFDKAICTKENVLGAPGKGKAHMFEGLNLERMGIAILDCGEMWNAVTHATIYCNLRKQMGQVILLHQGVGFTLTEMWAKTVNFTLACLKFCQIYDEALKKYEGHIPPALDMQLIPVAHALKYRGAILAERICYEAANLMGGAGVCDNTLMHDLLGLSRIQEVIGGTRQIQQYVMSMSLRKFFKSI
jgi:alkylation response protein AidB-like acyl-CoA dehydrogenase